MDFFNENEETLDLLKSIIRVGEIHSVNYENATARVHFPDDDDLVSYDMQILHRNTMKNKDYNMPDIGEDVLCLCLPSGLASGFILGSIYAGDVTPPENDGDKRTIVFSDGAKCSYDRKTSQMEITIGETEITANKKRVTMKTPLEVDITAAEVTVNAHKMHVNGDLGATLGATGVITGISVALVKNGIVTAIS